MISHPLMRTRLLVRRAAVIAAATLSLAIGGLAVRAAADWTAATAPLDLPPVSAKDLTQQLADEQARSASLEAQLAGLMGQSTDLNAALQAARDRATLDAKTAASLQAQLAATKKKLAALERAARQARTASAPLTHQATPRPTSHSSTGASGQGGSGGEGGDGPGDD
jgi:hypothetical protein